MQRTMVQAWVWVVETKRKELELLKRVVYVVVVVVVVVVEAVTENWMTIAFSERCQQH